MSRILLELTASAVTFTGDPDGTSEHTEKHTHTPLSVTSLSEPIFDFISIISSSLSPSILISLKQRESVEGTERWQDERRHGEVMGALYSSSICLLIPSKYNILQTSLLDTCKDERWINEVYVHTRFSGLCCDCLTPWSWTYRVEGLYLNLVLGKGI